MTPDRIDKQKGWILDFSTVFAKSLENLIQKIRAYQIPVQNRQEADREKLFKAGIHNLLIFLDSRVRGNDGSTNMIFL
ncbi:MAG: hypothetical protein BA872_08490 [Desulfobacterales bacterium C00003060]|nr:MAG: hypothetical protein BA872_08490 [Desulfobacterales bacterium C00003060]